MGGGHVYFRWTDRPVILTMRSANSDFLRMKENAAEEHNAAQALHRLTVPDIHETYKELSKRGVEFESPLEKQPWGGVLAHLRDPDGNVITLRGSPE